MKKKANGKGWHGDSRRHSMARKKISTTPKYSLKQSKGKSKLKIGLPDYSKEQIKHFTKLSDGKEWIAELNMVKGDIMIDDIQISEEVDHSYIRWNNGDEINNIGYIHYHPPTLIPEFSSQDFILAIELHELRKNKDKYPYTMMGLVYPEKDKLKVKIYAIRPNKNRKKIFEGKILTERDLKEEINMLINKKELMKLNNLSGEIK